jgi:hypothetical protein
MREPPVVLAQSCSATDDKPSSCGPTHVRIPSHEMTLDELLASSLVRRVMERDGVDDRSVRALLAPIVGTRLAHSG